MSEALRKLRHAYEAPPGTQKWLRPMNVVLRVQAAVLLCVMAAVVTGVWRFNLSLWCLPVLFCSSAWILPRVARRSLCEKLIAADLSLCPTCCYSLRGMPAQHNCPECGGAYSIAEITALWRAWLARAAPRRLRLYDAAQQRELGRAAARTRRTLLIGTAIVLTAAAGLGIALLRRAASVREDAERSADAHLARLFGGSGAEHLWDNATVNYRATHTWAFVQFEFEELRVDCGGLRSAKPGASRVRLGIAVDRVELECVCEFERGTRPVHIFLERGQSGSWLIYFLRVVRA